MCSRSTNPFVVLSQKIYNLIDQLTTVTVTDFFQFLSHFFSHINYKSNINTHTHAVRELGKFHGECYALKESNRGLFHIITKSFKEARFAVDCDEIYCAMLKTSPKRGTQAVREDAKLRQLIPEDFLKKIEHLTDDPWNYFKKCVEPHEPLAIICHGDFLRNNIAFQFDEKVGIFSLDFCFDMKKLNISGR